MCVCVGGGGLEEEGRKEKKKEKKEEKEEVNFDVFISVCSYFPSHTTFTVSIYINL